MVSWVLGDRERVLNDSSSGVMGSLVLGDRGRNFARPRVGRRSGERERGLRGARGTDAVQGPIFVVFVAACQVMKPFWKSLRRPSATAYSSDVG